MIHSHGLWLFIWNDVWEERTTWKSRRFEAGFPTVQWGEEEDLNKKFRFYLTYKQIYDTAIKGVFLSFFQFILEMDFYVSRGSKLYLKRVHNVDI
jgi:hypothetical protein